MGEQRRDNQGIRQGKAAKLQTEREHEPFRLGLVCVGASDLIEAYSLEGPASE